MQESNSVLSVFRIIATFAFAGAIMFLVGRSLRSKRKSDSSGEVEEKHHRIA